MRLSPLSSLATCLLISSSTASIVPQPQITQLAKRDDGLFTATDVPVFSLTTTILGVPVSKVIDLPASLMTTSTSSTSTSTSTTATTTSKHDPDAAPASTVNAFGDLIPTAIVYSPYEADFSCKSYDTITNDLEIIVSVGIPKIRMYGTDCNTINTVLPIAKSLGLKVNQGFWISPAGYSSITGYVDDLISWGRTNGWDIFDFITIGNEVVNSGYMSTADLISVIADVKTRLQAGGYPGLVTTSEPPVTYENHPELCTNSAIDIVGINPHSYFDPYSSAGTTGSFVLGQYNIVKNICGALEVLITETGYPSAGATNGGNVPSLANQAIAIEGILQEMNSKVTILSLYNDYWKDPGYYGIEQSFGTLRLYEGITSSAPS